MSNKVFAALGLSLFALFTFWLFYLSTGKEACESKGGIYSEQQGVCIGDVVK